LTDNLISISSILIFQICSERAKPCVD